MGFFSIVTQPFLTYLFSCTFVYWYLWQYDTLFPLVCICMVLTPIVTMVCILSVEFLGMHNE